MDALLKSGLNRKAIVVLIADQTRIGRADINRVLDSLKNLKRDYCK